MERVGLMVVAVPPAGAGAAWLAWCKLHINPIAMTTTGSIILAGGLFLANPSEPTMPRAETAAIEVGPTEFPMPELKSEEASAEGFHHPDGKEGPPKTHPVSVHNSTGARAHSLRTRGVRRHSKKTNDRDSQ